MPNAIMCSINELILDEIMHNCINATRLKTRSVLRTYTFRVDPMLSATALLYTPPMKTVASVNPTLCSCACVCLVSYCIAMRTVYGELVVLPYMVHGTCLLVPR